MLPPQHCFHHLGFPEKHLHVTFHSWEQHFRNICKSTPQFPFQTHHNSPAVKHYGIVTRFWRGVGLCLNNSCYKVIEDADKLIIMVIFGMFTKILNCLQFYDSYLSGTHTAVNMAKSIFIDMYINYWDKLIKSTAGKLVHQGKKKSDDLLKTAIQAWPLNC